MFINDNTIPRIPLCDYTLRNIQVDEVVSLSFSFVICLLRGYNFSLNNKLYFLKCLLTCFLKSLQALGINNNYISGNIGPFESTSLYVGAVMIDYIFNTLCALDVMLCHTKNKLSCLRRILCQAALRTSSDRCCFTI